MQSTYSKLNSKLKLKSVSNNLTKLANEISTNLKGEHVRLHGRKSAHRRRDESNNKYYTQGQNYYLSPILSDMIDIFNFENEEIQFALSFTGAEKPYAVASIKEKGEYTYFSGVILLEDLNPLIRDINRANHTDLQSFKEHWIQTLQKVKQADCPIYQKIREDYQSHLNTLSGQEDELEKAEEAIIEIERKKSGIYELSHQSEEYQALLEAHNALEAAQKALDEAQKDYDQIESANMALINQELNAALKYRTAKRNTYSASINVRNKIFNENPSILKDITPHI